MAKYRKKPVVIEAVQYHREQDLPAGVEVQNGVAIIRTLEGPMIVSDGDWVITGVKGEKYPCKPDIFEKTYDPAE